MVDKLVEGEHAGALLAIVRCECGQLFEGADSAEASMAYEGHLTDVLEQRSEHFEDWLAARQAEHRLFGAKPSGRPAPWVHPSETRAR